MKASINGPNRRKNRVGNKSIASEFDHAGSSSTSKLSSPFESDISFKVRSLEAYLKSSNGGSSSDIDSGIGAHENLYPGSVGSIGNACIFTVRRNDPDSAGCRLLRRHSEMSEWMVE